MWSNEAGPAAMKQSKAEECASGMNYKGAMGKKIQN
jgi:hypothetical protein